MWNRLTERTRKAVYSADEEARKRGSKTVLPEHLLLGILIDPNSVAVRILRELEVSIDQVKAAIDKKFPIVEEPSKGVMELSEAGRQAIDNSYFAARELNNSNIGTEHLLLGLMRGSDADVNLMLTGYGASYGDVLAATRRLQEDSA